MAPYEAYGAKLKAYRKRLGLSVAEFAERLGVSKATQANYEAGRTVPDLAYADRCSPLGIPPEELLCSRAAKILDQSPVPVELHRIIEQHALEVRRGGSTAPLYAALWDLLLSAGVTDRIEPQASDRSGGGPAAGGLRRT